MLFRAEIENENFKMTNLFDWISSVIDIGTFFCRADGIHLKAMSPDHVLMIDVHIVREDFNIYDVKGINGSEEVVFRMNLCDISRLFKHFTNPKDTTAMWIDEKRNKLNFKVRRKRFDLSLLAEDEEEEVPCPKLDFNARFTANTAEIKDFLKFAEKYGDYITFTVKDGYEQILTLATSGDIGNMDEEIPLDPSGTHHIKDTQMSIYSLEHLKDMFKPQIDKVEIELSTEMPLQIKYYLTSRSYIQYLLAPRVEEEEDFEDELDYEDKDEFDELEEQERSLSDEEFLAHVKQQEAQEAQEREQRVQDLIAIARKTRESVSSEVEE